MRTKIDVLNELKNYLSDTFNSVIEKNMHTNEYMDGAFGQLAVVDSKINELLEEERIIKYLLDMGAISNEG